MITHWELMVTRHELSELTRHVDGLPVECDGASRLISLALTRSDIPHRPMAGLLPNGLPHRWIEVDCAEGITIIDYRLRAWLGDDVPHGIFDPSEFTYAYPSRWYIGIRGSLILEETLCVLLPLQRTLQWTT